MCRGCEIKDRLKLKAVVCVFDQAFYAKADEIFWRHRDMFENLAIMLGGFHLLMMLLGVMGMRFGDASLREIAIQSGAVAEGSIEKVLEGKNYNRAVRRQKIVCEALSRTLLDKFEASLPENVMDVSEQKNTVIENLKLNLSQEEYQKVVASSEFKNWKELLMAHISDIRNKGSDLEKFWHTYLDLCELLQNNVFATRSGNWELYLSCIKEVIP